MENKKIKILLIITVLLPLSLILFSDNSQYKQIGDTKFYLLPDWEGNGSFLYHSGDLRDGFYNIKHYGVINEVYWNNQFVICKCGESHKDSISHWYILKNIKEYNYKEFHMKQYNNANDYESALDSLHISEKSMKHTNGKIPWRIHLW